MIEFITKKYTEVNNENNKKERNIKIDIIKGISIFLVLWGHYIQYTTLDEGYYDNWIFKIIYSFHMPLFMLISGYLFYGTLNKNNMKQILVSRLKGFIIPLIICSVISWLFTSMYKRNFNIIYLWDIFTKVHLWFLWSIIASSLCLAFIQKFLPKAIHIPSLIMGFFIMYLFPHSELNLYMYPYFIIGYYYKKNEKK